VVLPAVVWTEVVILELQQLGNLDVPRDKIEWLQACVATTVLFLFISRGGVGIECLTSDLVTTAQQGGIILYHRDRKGQREVALEY
jgi:hypothetical protein